MDFAMDGFIAHSYGGRRNALWTTSSWDTENCTTPRERRSLRRELVARAPAASRPSRRQRHSIQQLPDQVLLEIFRLLPLDVLARVAQVCCRWRALSNAKVLWCDINLDFLRYIRLSETASLDSLRERLGPHTQRLMLPPLKVTTKDFVKLVQDRCSNLRHLDISRQRPGVCRASIGPDTWFWSHSEEDDPRDDPHEDIPYAVFAVPQTLESLSIFPGVLPRWARGPFPQLRTLQLLENSEYERVWRDEDLPDILEQLPRLEDFWVAEPLESWHGFQQTLRHLPLSIRRLDIGCESVDFLEDSRGDDASASVPGASPPWMSNLGTLTHLWLRFANFVPEHFCEAVATACPLLQAFGLRKGFAQHFDRETLGVEHLAKLQHLRHLSFSGVWVTTKMADLLQGVRLSSLQILGELEHGEARSALTNAIEDMDTLERLHLRLYVASLFGLHVTLNLRKLKQLRSLRLQGNIILDEGMQGALLDDLPRLRELHYERSEHAAVRDLPCISVTGTRLFKYSGGASDVDEFAVFPRVRHIRFAMPHLLSDKDCASIVRWFPNLERFDYFHRMLEAPSEAYQRDMREMLHLPVSCLRFRYMERWNDAGFEYLD